MCGIWLKAYPWDISVGGCVLPSVASILLNSAPEAEPLQTGVLSPAGGKGVPCGCAWRAGPHEGSALFPKEREWKPCSLSPLCPSAVCPVSRLMAGTSLDTGWPRKVVSGVAASVWPGLYCSTCSRPSQQCTECPCHWLLNKKSKCSVS